ncbi:hypothetical protein [Halobaculum sp. MBLA0143]|uniref:hypothetical protein n=1 Tax=Halobaculum sp. MBLA0143 TaxID=3079933 RepID=UPI003524886E
MIRSGIRRFDVYRGSRRVPRGLRKSPISGMTRRLRRLESLDPEAVHRSMWLVSLLLGGLYYGYSFLRVLEVTQKTVAYQTYISSAGFPPEIIMAVATSVGLFSYRVFRDAKHRHQRYYVQYLVSDFLTLYEAERIEDGDPTTANTTP